MLQAEEFAFVEYQVGGPAYSPIDASCVESVTSNPPVVLGELMANAADSQVPQSDQNSPSSASSNQSSGPSSFSQRNVSVQTAVLALGGTLAFYIVAPQVPGISNFVERYFCSHPLEYISTLMFFTGTSILFLKALRLKNERTVLNAARVSAQDATDTSPDQRMRKLQQWCAAIPQDLSRTQIAQRLRETLHYLTGTRRDGLEDHLRYLAELAHERLHQSFATIRTITWAIPIVGFLGTVIGITMAIANVTPEQLDSSLGDVTRGLSVAFDTTALALGMSIVLVFASFIVERSEQRVLSDVEQFGIDVLVPWFAGAAQASNARSLDVVGSEGEAWKQQLATFRQVWGEVLTEHTRAFRSTLQAEVQETLAIHRDATSEARDAYTGALHETAASVAAQTLKVVTELDNRLLSWTSALQASSQSSVEQTEALHQLGSVLLRMTEAEERLTTLQKQLNDNLHALKLADTMEQSANSLTAAVHLLTAKTQLRAAA